MPYSFQSSFLRKELTKWEDIPNKREPYTVDMLKEHRRVITSKQHNQDSLFAALGDWFEQGLFLGPRIAEWAQSGSASHILPAFLNKRGQTYAFTILDLEYQGVSGRLYTAAKAA